MARKPSGISPNKKVPSVMMLGLNWLGALLGASEAILAVVKRSRSRHSSVDAGSLGLLWLVIMCSVIVAVVLAPMTSPTAWSTSGCIVFVFGAMLRWYSISYLGRWFTVDVQIASDHELVDTGPYRLIRHPSYTGLLLEFLGFGMSLGSVLPVLVLMVPITWGLMYRIRVEEGALERGLGERYAAYRLKTRRLIPYIY